MPLNNHNLDDMQKGLDEVEAGNAQYKSEWPELCKQLSITPFMLNRIDPRILIALMLVRMNALYATKMMDLETRLLRLERLNAGPIAPHSPVRKLDG